MTTRIKYLALAGSVALLAACSSNNDDTPNGGVVPVKGIFDAPIEGTPEFIAIVTEANVMADTFIDLNNGELDDPSAQRTSLPDAGGATYTGFIGGVLNGEGMMGDLELTATFAGGDSGSITNVEASGFEHQSAGAVGGTLTGSGLILPDAGGGDIDLFDADLNGNLTIDGDVLATEITLDGSFFGGAPGDPTTVAGGFIGNVAGDAFDGAFVAD